MENWANSDCKANGFLQHIKTLWMPARKSGDHNRRYVHFFLSGFHMSITKQQVCDLCGYSDTETTATSFQGAVAEKQRSMCLC